MKKTILPLTLLALTALACNMTVSFAPTSQPEPEPTRVSPTLTLPAAPTQAVPTQPQPTSEVPNLPEPTVPPQPLSGSTITFHRLTVTLPQTVANGASGSEIPRNDSPEAAQWQKTPGHLQVSLDGYYALQGKTNQPAIYVFPALEYAELAPAAFESIHRLRNYLYDPNNVPALDQMPGVPFMNAKILFAAQILPLSFQNGTGVRYITEYAQGPVQANNTDLFYNYIGVTDDGNDYVVVILPITSPVLAESGDLNAPVPSGGVPYPDNGRADPYFIAISDLLNVQPGGSFSPSLDMLDSLIQSISIAP
ncbi:hypothetical protein [Levilinea saccharolytica]|uniref:Uncharacterized protein n=1 Tax=Levilinea saccharolytica TaxID=229921 RepID=A0A0P6YND0_9CHLR|nr:hypothetical protein [Levilinea saccharolytica]KPL91791.1 hypothetical protein ADN01_00465 [Levilinea saccharolytica]GAP17602.1 hypothetical protein LSAC_01477 [Levilinea saccharolytica]